MIQQFSSNLNILLKSVHHNQIIIRKFKYFIKIHSSLQNYY
jgi:hypothetical protein